MDLFKLRILIIIVLIMLITTVHSDIVKSNEELLIKAYGYLIGQEYSLSKILEFNPNLKSEVVKARLNFNSTFGKAEKNIELELESLFGDNFNTYKSQMVKQLKEMTAISTYEKEKSLVFLKEVDKRAKGKIEKPILETLLTFQFIDNPSKEFTTGFLKSYTTKGHSKSKDVIINAKVPLSWKQEEAERPNIVQKFTSNNGKGLEGILFLVKDSGLPEDYIITEEELNEFFTVNELKQMIPDNNDFVSAQKIYLDGQIGGEITFTTTRKRLDFSITMKSIYFITIVEGKMFFLQCMVSSSNNQDLADRFNLFLPLFKKVANSLVFPNKYTKNNIIKTENIIKSINNTNVDKSDFGFQKDIALKKIDEGIGRIGSFLLIIFFYIIFKTIQWFIIKKKISENMVNKAKNNIQRLGKYAIVWAVIQVLPALFFISSCGVINLIITLLIVSIIGFAGYKLYKQKSYSFKPIISIFTITLIYSIIIPFIGIFFLIQDETTLGEIGFLWIKLINNIQIIRFGPAILTLILWFLSISSIFAFLIIHRYKKKLENSLQTALLLKNE